MGSHCSFGHLKHKLWRKEGSGVKLAVWLPTTKSRESTSSRHPNWECDMALERSRRGLQRWFKPRRDWTLQSGIMSSQSPGTATETISGLQLGSPGKKNHLDVASVESWRIYYKGEGHFVWVLCRSVWMSKACQIFLVPSRSSDTPLYPSKCRELGSVPRLLFLLLFSYLGPHLGPLKSWECVSKGIDRQMFYIWNLTSIH
jgi:hypothetical protein